MGRLVLRAANLRDAAVRRRDQHRRQITFKSLRGNDSVSKRAQTRKRNHPPPSFLETSRVDGVKAPPHFKTRRYAPAKPFSATASIAPPFETLHRVCRKRTTQPPCLSGINPRGAAARLSTRHRGYDDLRAASKPRAINVVDDGWSPRASAQQRITVGGPDGAKANNLTTTSSDSAPSM